MRKEVNITFKKNPLLDGLISKNTILVSGLVIAPVVFLANTVAKALTLMFVFSTITFLTIMISSFIPRNIFYTIRIILYTVIASLVYIPVVICAYRLFPEQASTMGIMLPLLIANSLILTKSETRFFRETKGRMLVDVLAYITGFNVVTILFAFIREFFGRGMIGDKIMGISFTVPILTYPFAGFILLGLLAALFRVIKSYFSE